MMMKLTVFALLVLASCGPFSPRSVDNSAYDDLEQKAVRTLFYVWRDAIVSGNLELAYRSMSTRVKEAYPYYLFQKEYGEFGAQWKRRFSAWEAKTIGVEHNASSICVREGMGNTFFIDAVKEEDGWKINYFVASIGYNK